VGNRTSFFSFCVPFCVATDQMEGSYEGIVESFQTVKLLRSNESHRMKNQVSNARYQTKSDLTDNSKVKS